VQTFLPYPDFLASARVLDNRRLGKQRVETLQILNALTNSSYGWQNHPAVKMWRGHTAHLVLYGLAICAEWKRRGFNDTCAEKIAAFMPSDCENAQPPRWLGNADFHASHRSNLLRKEPAHYSQWHWIDGPDLPYVWPSP
jgi:hypothetical protein